MRLMESQLLQVNVELDQHSDDISVLQTQTTTLSASVGDLQFQVDGMEIEVEGNSADITSLELRADAVDVRLDSLGVTTDALVLQVGTLEVEVLDLYDQIGDLQLADTTQDIALSGLEDQIDDLQASDALQNTALAGLGNQVEELNVEFPLLEDRVTALEALNSVYPYASVSGIITMASSVATLSVSPHNVSDFFAYVATTSNYVDLSYNSGSSPTIDIQISSSVVVYSQASRNDCVITGSGFWGNGRGANATGFIVPVSTSTLFMDGIYAGVLIRFSISNIADFKVLADGARLSFTVSFTS